MIPGLDRLRERFHVLGPSGRLIGGSVTRLLLDEAGRAFWASGNASQRPRGAGGIDKDGMHAGATAVAGAGVVGVGLWLDTSKVRDGRGPIDVPRPTEALPPHASWVQSSSREADVAKKTTIRAIGNSAGTTMPKAMLKRYRLDEGDRVHLVETEDGILITPFDPAFAEAMPLYEEGAKQYRNAMRNLPKRRSLAGSRPS